MNVEKTTQAIPKAESFDEERIPFDVVMRKLANTKPPHKTVKPAPQKPKKG